MAAKKPLILHIDDDPITRALVEETLGQEGMEVLSTATVAEGLSLGLQRTPDLILLDITLRGVDGFEACASFRKVPGLRDVPILMLSGMDHIQNVEKSLACGATGFISKPFEIDRLVASVRRWLEPQ
ncbi:MAG: response regulator [Elusimicrobia bacterium]|nr:response regulator [Elusimicrobiota bacterium]